MTRVKNLPIGVSDYYKELKAEYEAALEEAKLKLEDAANNKIKLKDDLIKSLSLYKKELGINLEDYTEFVDNKYIDGSLEKTVFKIYRNSTEQSKVQLLLSIIKYVNAITQEFENSKKVSLYTKIVEMSYAEFKQLLKTYYYEVQRQMIVNGYGYKFQGDIGVVCINRCKNESKAHILDTKATRKNIQKLKDEGKEIYDEKKAQYYALHGLKYEGVNPKVYTVNNYLYEFCLIYSRLPDKFTYKFSPYMYWADPLRGKTKEDFIEESGGNLSYICSLDINFTTKITICNELDPTIYLNLIRNDRQTPITTRKNHRKG